MGYKPQILILLYLIITLSYIFTSYIITGEFHSFNDVLLTLVSFLALLVYYFKPHLFENLKAETGSLLKISFIFSVFLSLTLYGGLYQSHGFLYKTSQYLLAISCILALSYFIDTKTKLFVKYRFPALFCIAILLQVFMIISSPHPKIDVFDQLKYGSEGLFKGQNPYSQNFPQIYNYPQDYFPYLPMTAIVVLPFNLLFGDPRFALVASYIVGALVLRKITGERNVLASELIPLIYLFHPQVTFMTEQAWIDPLFFTFFVLFIYYLRDKNSLIFSGITLGVGIALKQTFPLILIFLFAYKAIPKKVLIIALGVLIISCLPFFIWNRNDFLNDVVKIHTERRLWWHNSLTLNSFFFSEFKKNINQLVFMVVWLGLLFAILKRGITNFTTLTLATSLWFFSFYLFNYQAYIHYYHFITSMILLSLALPVKKENKLLRSKNS